MESQNAESSVASECNGLQDHPHLLPRQRAMRIFETALTRLGVHGHIDVVELFNGRVTRNMVVDWRRGRNRIPLWAFQYVATLIETRATIDTQIVEQCRNPPAVAPGTGSGKEIMRWNARRTKEKARRAFIQLRHPGQP